MKYQDSPLTGVGLLCYVIWWSENVGSALLGGGYGIIQSPRGDSQ
jgi:hypothetical protein